MTTNTPSPETPAVAAEKSNKSGLIWLVLFIVVAAVGGYAFYKAGQPGQIIVTGGGRGGSGGGGRRGGGGLGPTPVVVNRVKKTSVPDYDPGIGSVVPYYSVTLKPLVSGQILSINFQEGDLVKKDQILFEIDPRPFQVTQAQAEGQLARDQAQLTDALKDQARYHNLLKTNAIPSQTADTQDALVGQLQGTVKTDQANIDNSKLNQEYARVRAPFTGRCGLRLVDPGNVVQANTTGLLVISQVQPIAVNFTIPQDWLPPVLQKLRAGAKLQVEAWNRDNSQKLDTGTLLTVDNQIDPTTGTSKLKAIFDNRNEVLFPNQFVNIKLLVQTIPDQIVVPTVAVQHGQQGAFVYVVGENSRVTITPVTTGIVRDEIGTQILSGLEEGQQVVVDGTDRLQNNSQVRLRTATGGDVGGRGGSGRRGGRGGSGRRGGFGGGGGAQADAGADTAGAGAADAGGGGGFGRRGSRGGSGRGGRGGSGRRRGGGTPE